MKSFAEILDRFSTGQRVFVLILLLVFSSATYLGGSYMKADSCSSLVKENRELLEDYIAIVRIIKSETRINELRENEIKSKERQLSSREPASVITEDTTIVIEPLTSNTINEKILKIAEKHINKKE